MNNRLVSSRCYFTNGKIASSAVTNSKIGSSAVSASKIATGLVTSSKIADGTITSTDVSGSFVEIIHLGDSDCGSQTCGWDPDGSRTAFRLTDLGSLSVP